MKKSIPAKVGTQPYGAIQIHNCRRIYVGRRVKWKPSGKPGGKWRDGIVTKFYGDPRDPSYVFIDMA